MTQFPFKLFFVASLLAACAAPNTKAINSFASGLDATSISFLEAFAATNSFVEQEKGVFSAREFA